MDIIGVWHIIEMEMWDKAYFNMVIQAFIRIDQDYNGDFQFGLVSGDFRGKVTDFDAHKRLEFTFNGTDEYDPCSGSGWIEEKKGESNVIEGKFRFHNSDDSWFLAKRANR